MAGIVNLVNVQRTDRALTALDDYIRTETLKTIEARRARAQQDLKLATQKYTEYVDQQSKAYNEKMDQALADYKEEQQLRLEAANEDADQEFIDEIKESLDDEETREAIMSSGNNEEYNENLIKAYESTPGLAVRVVNTVFPSKRISQESGWDRFTNSIEKGFHYFVKWMKEEGWRLLLEIGLQCILAFVPGIGQMLGMVLSIGGSALIDILDTCKTSAERVALQRAINEGKSRGLDDYDEMFMWRALIIILMVTVADIEGLTIDGNQLKALMATKDDFMRHMKNDEFVKTMWSCESKMIEMMAGEDPTTNEPDFQFYPEDVAECRQVALDLLSDGRMRGFIAGIPKSLKPLKQILK